MTRLFLPAILIAISFSAQPVLAAEEYNEVPSGDKQYKNCKIYSMNKWEGGGESSPIPGQSKAEAFCTCLWNETPEDFSGGLAKFSESAMGVKVNAICERYSNWGY